MLQHCSYLVLKFPSSFFRKKDFKHNPIFNQKFPYVGISIEKAVKIKSMQNQSYVLQPRRMPVMI